MVLQVSEVALWPTDKQDAEGLPLALSGLPSALLTPRLSESLGNVGPTA